MGIRRKSTDQQHLQMYGGLSTDVLCKSTATGPQGHQKVVWYWLGTVIYVRNLCHNQEMPKFIDQIVKVKCIIV